MVDLSRFRQAQDDSTEGFETAMRELRRGRKQSHWIWYVFPQIAGLGSSPMSKRYALEGTEDAVAYLADEVLGARFEQAAEIVASRLALGAPLTTLMGSSIDALKLVSCMTLFERAASCAAPENQDRFANVASLACRILDHAEKQGYSRCSHTLKIVGTAQGNG